MATNLISYKLSQSQILFCGHLATVVVCKLNLHEDYDNVCVEQHIPYFLEYSFQFRHLDTFKHCS